MAGVAAHGDLFGAVAPRFARRLRGAVKSRKSEVLVVYLAHQALCTRTTFGTAGPPACASVCRPSKKPGPSDGLFARSAEQMKKGRSCDQPFSYSDNCEDYSRLPIKFSKNINMLMKSRYRRSAPMIADLPNHSLSPCSAWAIYSFLIDWVS